MQKINIKKYTKEQMLKMLEEAQDKQEAAEAEAAEGSANRKGEMLDEALHRLEAEKAIAEDYHESLKWCMAHPWRNLWRCMKEYFRF